MSETFDTPPPNYGPPPDRFAGYPGTERTGPAWENPNQPVFERWFETVKSVFLGPSDFFVTMKRDAGIGGPLVFGVIGGTIAVVVSTVLQTLLQVAGLGFATQGDAGSAVVTMGGLVLQGVCAVLLGPVFVAVGIFIGSGILHLILMLVGGARQPYETTFRVVCYVNGSIGLLPAIPICGQFVGMIWILVAEIIGLSKAHEISGGRAAAAVLLPIAVCCGLAIAIMAVFGVAFGSEFFAQISQR